MVMEPIPQTKQKKLERLQLLAEKERRYRENKLHYFVPNRHQKLFLNKTSHCDELYLSGGNRTGKTTTGSLGASIWSTGRYPSWFYGKKFDHPTRGMIMGDSDKQLRKAAQRVLMGEEGQWGTGMLPKDSITDEKGNFTVYMKHDPRGCIDYIQVKSEFGGYSYIYFATYGQGREAVQGDELHWIWCDEPPRDDLYGELVARILTTNGVIYVTATPMTGYSEVVQRFLMNEEDEENDRLNRRYFMSVSQGEVEHLTDQDRQRFWEACPPHERQARVEGIPMLGEGQVFECTRDMLVCDPFDLNEKEWLRLIIGLDFGFNDPTAAVLLACDPNPSGKHYVVRSYQQKFQLPEYHAIRIKAWGEGIPCSWPRDGHRVGLGSPSLQKVKDQYRQAGLNMLPNPAFSTYNASTEGSNLEAGVQVVYKMIHTDTLKIFDTQENQDLIKKIVMYHRQEGKINPRQEAHKVDALRAACCEISKSRSIYEIEQSQFGKFKKQTKANTTYSLN